MIIEHITHFYIYYKVKRRFFTTSSPKNVILGDNVVRITI